MADRWEHARSIGPALASSLAELERRSTAPGANLDSDQLSRAVAETWDVVIDDARAGRFELSAEYLGRLHERLSGSAGAAGPGQFTDKGPAGHSWSGMVPELMVDGGFDDSFLTDAAILAELRWGGHVQSLALSLGWLCLNGVHLCEGVWAIYPPPGDHYRLLRCLEYAGPDSWDPESLRSVFGDYTTTQQPR